MELKIAINGRKGWKSKKFTFFTFIKCYADTMYVEVVIHTFNEVTFILSWAPWKVYSTQFCPYCM